MSKTSLAMCFQGWRTIKNQDGKLVARTKPAIPVFLYDYFFFLPAGFAAFFFAAMFITSDRFMEFHSAIFADGVIYLTAWLYEEMPGAGNDYFIDIFFARGNCDHRPPAKSFARDKLRLELRVGILEIIAGPELQIHSRAHR